MSKITIEMLNAKLSMCKIDSIDEFLLPPVENVYSDGVQGKIMKYFINENEVKTNKREYKICNSYEDTESSNKRKRV